MAKKRQIRRETIEFTERRSTAKTMAAKVNAVCGRGAATIRSRKGGYALAVKKSCLRRHSLRGVI